MSKLAPLRSLRGYLLAGIILPIALFIAIDALHLYRSALDSANTAYDRMLVTTAYSIGDRISIEGGQLRGDISYAALEVYEAGYSTRMIYKISDYRGRHLAGDPDLPAYRGGDKWLTVPALLKVYEGTYGSAPVRIAVVAQPGASHRLEDNVIIQIAEPLVFRQDVARDILWGTVLRQAMLLFIVAAVTYVVVTRALRPLDSLRAQLLARQEDDLSPLSTPTAARELQPVVAALNDLMSRLHRMVDMQQRFVANASHQLRTPLAVLKMQLQSGVRGDIAPDLALLEMRATVDRATNVANQLLSLARVEQMRGKGTSEQCDLLAVAREVAIDLSPLISDKNLEFELEASSAWVHGRAWMASEMVSNLLHNAIRHTPSESRLGIRIAAPDGAIELCVWDTGPGVADQEMRVFEPFAGSHSSKGGGLGLAICAEIADAMGARLSLRNREKDGKVEGLDACVRFSL
ncbi:HAMP domain-containing protein [Duganella sp. FT92W]|uniref:histidine kinase n=1 Tax=Pseudoduganella rivuli TaxID=2666085 RepID=A0A7X2ITD6_9BURK|nr:sensor histidine kinase [Pseudoduganella rivuli]MRV75684.1 HAMP domain-containing protein [Pseudoduganella rivuli]